MRRRRPVEPVMGAAPVVPAETSSPESLGGFLHDLAASGRFCRDTRMGGVLHRGGVSYREVSDGESLHVSIVDGTRVSVHVDHFSPVAGTRDDGCCTYSVRAVVSHLWTYLAAQARQLARGARGRHRCRLVCEQVEVNDGDDARLLDTILCGCGDDHPPASTADKAACTASISDRSTRSSAV